MEAGAPESAERVLGAPGLRAVWQCGVAPPARQKDRRWPYANGGRIVSLHIRGVVRNEPATRENSDYHTSARMVQSQVWLVLHEKTVPAAFVARSAPSLLESSSLTEHCPIPTSSFWVSQILSLPP